MYVQYICKLVQNKIYITSSCHVTFFSENMCHFGFGAPRLPSDWYQVVAFLPLLFWLMQPNIPPDHAWKSAFCVRHAGMACFFSFSTPQLEGREKRENSSPWGGDFWVNTCCVSDKTWDGGGPEITYSHMWEQESLIPALLEWNIGRVKAGDPGKLVSQLAWRWRPRPASTGVHRPDSLGGPRGKQNEK